MTPQRRNDDEHVYNVLRKAEDAVQKHLAVDLNAGMADLMARRERRNRHLHHHTRRLIRWWKRWFCSLRPRRGALVIVEAPHIIGSDTGSVGATHLLRPRRWR